VKHYTKQELETRFLNAAHDCCEWNKKRNVVVDGLTTLMAMNEYPDVEAFFVVNGSFPLWLTPTFVTSTISIA
jgi:hypothetical protein